MIDPQVVTLLKAEWKLPRDTTDEEFRETYRYFPSCYHLFILFESKKRYLQQMSSENCVGYDAMLYTWRRDAKGELVCLSRELRRREWPVEGASLSTFRRSGSIPGKMHV